MRLSLVWPKWLAGLLLAVTFLLLAAPVASAETRTLKLYFIHTREKAEITYKRNGRYIQSGLNEINRFLRDWRRNEPTNMDTQLLDLLWETYRAAGGRDYIHVVSAYRSPATNAALRSRSNGVAQKSQHMLGKAIDFYVPGVKLSTLRNAALRVQGGGVGYYPNSGSPFVHLDVGNVRHWPRLSRSQLAAVFPDGRTIHVPSDGKPLPGYDQALAAYKQRQRSGATVQIAEESRRRPGGFLSALFGGGADEAEESSGAVAVAAAPQPAPASSRQASASALPGVSSSQQRPAAPVQAAPPPVVETPETIIAALPARSVPIPGSAPRPQVAVGIPVPVETVAAAPVEAAPAEVPSAPVEETAVALDIPLPTARPSYTPPAEPVVVAAAETDEDALPSLPAEAVVPSSAQAVVAGMLRDAPADEDDGMALASAFAPVPSSRPALPGADILTAALPERERQSKPEMLAGVALSAPDTEETEAPAVSAANDIILQKGGRLAIAGAPSQRLALLDREDSVPVSQAIDSGVRTTGKAPKPARSDARPDPRSVVVPVQQEIARWALSNAPVVQNVNGTTAPSFAYNLVRTAPRTVYTAGFRQAAPASDVNRFTGKAVEFLSVARFN